MPGIAIPGICATADTQRNGKCSTVFGWVSPFMSSRMLNARTPIFPGIEIVGALIFDFDGVIADSEAIANTVLAETVTDLGHSTTLDQALARYSGRRWDEAVAEIEATAPAAGRGDNPVTWSPALACSASGINGPRRVAATGTELSRLYLRSRRQREHLEARKWSDHGALARPRSQNFGRSRGLEGRAVCCVFSSSGRTRIVVRDGRRRHERASDRRLARLARRSSMGARQPIHHHSSGRSRCSTSFRCAPRPSFSCGDHPRALARSGVGSQRPLRRLFRA